MSKSPNYMSRNGWKPDMIVNHVAEGTFYGTISWCCNPNSGVSCHFVSGENGEIDNLVDLDKAAWCNGTSTASGAKYDYRRATNRLVRERATNANYYTISIEHAGFSYKDRCGGLTEAQYNAVLNLHKELITKYDIPVDREHIVGHYEIAPKEKPNCPGPQFPWDRLMADLTAWKTGTEVAEVSKDVPVEPYTVKINSDDGFLNVRAGAGMSYKVNETVKNGGVYTIVAENGPWGKLKSGAGYIYLPLTKKVELNRGKVYYSACGSHHTSIVDALNSINVNSSYSNRAKIAKANGIKGYLGLPSQNIKMLNLLKQGKLIKA